MDQLAEKEGLTADQVMRIKNLHTFGVMSEMEVRDALIDLRPYMASILDGWNHGSIKHVVLSSVGIAIGHAAIKMMAGEFGQLSNWIN